MSTAAICASHPHTTKEDTHVLRVKESPWHALGMQERASLMDGAAFSVVINLLVVITALIPAP